METCRDCGRKFPSKDMYRISLRGCKLKQPRCWECHEEAVRKDSTRRPRERDTVDGIPLTDCDY